MNQGQPKKDRFGRANFWDTPEYFLALKESRYNPW